MACFTTPSARAVTPFGVEREFFWRAVLSCGRSDEVIARPVRCGEFNHVGSHLLNQFVIMKILVRRQIERIRNAFQFFVTDLFDVLLHEIIVGVPVHALCSNGRLFGAQCDLVRV